MTNRTVESLSPNITAEEVRERCKKLFTNIQSEMPTDYPVDITRNMFYRMEGEIINFDKVKTAWAKYQNDLRPETRNDFLRVCAAVMGKNKESQT